MASQLEQEAFEDFMHWVEPHIGTTVDAEFVQFYLDKVSQSHTSLRPFTRVRRHFRLCELFRDTIMNVPGEFAECGCYAGLSTLELNAIYRFVHPHIRNGAACHIFDSFQGLSNPTAEDLDNLPPDLESLAQHGQFAAPESHVRAVLDSHGFTGAHIYAGWIPSRFPEVQDRRFAFVHIDVDLYAPTKDSVEWFYPLLNVGGVILTDDDDWPGASKAFRDYAKRHGLSVQHTDAGQAYMVKI